MFIIFLILSICSLSLQAETINIQCHHVQKIIRKVNNMPSVAGFRPVISNNSCEETIFLHFEEYETIRLCDYEMKNPAGSLHLNGCVTPYPQPNIYQCKAKR